MTTPVKLPTDPFLVKRLKKTSPRRLAFTAGARFQDWISKKLFEKVAMPILEPSTLPEVPNYDRCDTAVTPIQMRVLVAAMDHAQSRRGQPVEIGAYRGVTTSILAKRSPGPYFAVDPFIGYGGAKQDLDHFTQRTKHLPNVTHLRMTSGEAVRGPGPECVSFAFIDAVHDYVNVRFDGIAWGERISTGGVIAFHDTDEMCFAGVRRAVWKQLHQTSSKWVLWAHVNGLVILQKT